MGGLRLLLDTHTLLYALIEPKRLSPLARSLLEDSQNTRLVSMASLWEIAIKSRLGRFPQGEAVLSAYPGWLEPLKARELPIQGPHALLAPTLPGDHRDPFDRMLVAQSLLERVVLLSHDEALRGLGASVLW
ncbi:type II toxin-antitoxin system VapC family toxin [Thermus albus]|uniref:type II toxin-antitoxin system VapC family toxin n=1 Tax=Thermus albus TaxID=2908146 RepID=UPI001FAA3EDC|nr:type II toxin-antitoxin system VapC family toxin [Thermus albus]